MSAEQLERGRAFWQNPAERICQAIQLSGVAETAKAKALLQELAGIRNEAVELPVLGSQTETEPTSRPSTAGRAKARRQ